MQKLFVTILLAVAPFLMGFSLDNAVVPRSDILSGGPPKDAIPALLEPTFVSAGESDFMNPGDAIIGVVVAGQPKAYPIKILTWHEVVNDSVGERPFVVTF
jgi:hypothetical protein